MSRGSFELGTSGSVFAVGPSFGVGSTSALDGVSATGVLGCGASLVCMSSSFWASPAQAAALKAALTINKPQSAYEPPFVELCLVSFIVDSIGLVGNDAYQAGPLGSCGKGDGVRETVYAEYTQ